jgi:hypothetical protein
MEFNSAFKGLIRERLYAHPAVRVMDILHEISKRKANWIGHILRRNCLLQRIIEGKRKQGGEK